VDEPTSVRKFRVAPRASYAPLGQLPACFRAGRSGWHKTKFCSTMGLFKVCLARTGSFASSPGSESERKPPLHGAAWGRMGPYGAAPPAPGRMGLRLGAARGPSKKQPGGGEQARGAGCYLLRWRWANNQQPTLALGHQSTPSLLIYLLRSPPAQ
jgi:hypothetical protein